ncbi:Zinc finger protein CONSTANS-LIKE 1 [Glycine soja]|uniref:Zinc finger protein CONSTANS-LIKE 1 n=1 Tax=Glycine soja TaxID=3848 RepID=A0A0B2P4S0_GLYSO|nr:Zinc finger protein CONSTANS-LIKE 1 [Glycine soja]
MKPKTCELCHQLASLYCPSDSAFLCFHCDAAVHAANFLVARHLRRLLCSKCNRFAAIHISGAISRHLSSTCTSCSLEIPSADSDSLPSSSTCVSSSESCSTNQIKAEKKRRRRRRSFSSSSVTDDASPAAKKRRRNGGGVEVASVQGGCCDVVLVGAEILWGQRPRHVSESGEVGSNIWSASKADSGRTCQPGTCLHAPPRNAGRMGRVLADDSYSNAL